MTCISPHLVVNVSLAVADRDYDLPVDLLGHQFRILRRGTAGDVDVAVDLIREYGTEAAAIAVTGFHDAAAAGLYHGTLAAARKILGATDQTPLTDGHQLDDVLQEWAIRQVQNELPGHFTNARTVVLGGRNHSRAVAVLREFTDNIEFADPLLRLADLEASIESNTVVHRALELGRLPWEVVPDRLLHLATAPLHAVQHAVQPLVEQQITSSGRSLSHGLTRRAAHDCHVIVASYDELEAFGLDDLSGKTVITSAVSEQRLEALAARGVDMVIDAAPQPFDVTVTTAMLEAMLRATNHKRHTLSNSELLQLIDANGLEPRVLYPNGERRKSRFAFVIHPLSQEYFKNVKPLAPVMRVPGSGGVVEKVVAHTPPFVYSRVTGVTSPTGAQAEGWLITVGGTPKEIMSHPPEFTYGKLLQAAGIARKLGAQVMGLGAFTKVVGDAGATVARRSVLPITTGNSYSASAALWAGQEAVRRLDLCEVDDAGAIAGATMVVGATGSIGSVCARLLAQTSDELWMVSPETAKLLAIKHDIESENPRAVIHVADSPGPELADMDLIVTATSAAGQKVLDIMQVKPGCVITDVARPLDLSAEDVARRPDVLVIESGEISLPGDVKMGDIGLPPGVVYACLAETIVLALEGRYETFTVGRDIEWEKVQEIYRLGLKHGMALATISGVKGPFTDADFDRVRAAATAARANV